MAKNTQLSNAIVNEQADLLARALDNGYLRIYDGAQPATADTVVTTQNLLAELRFNATSAPSAVSGILTFNPITSDSAANMTGVASWFRCLKADGSSVVMDGTVGLSADSPNMSINSVNIQENTIITCTSFVHDTRNATSGY